MLVNWSFGKDETRADELTSDAAAFRQGISHAEAPNSEQSGGVAPYL